MFYQNYDGVHGEDRWGMVGKIGDPFQEDRLLALACAKCHCQPLVIAERNWVTTNNDGSQRYQIRVACTHCGFADEFAVNAKKEGVITTLKHGHQSVTPADLLAE
ncbi:MAG: hypothetical protein Q3978_03450 [Limosilactobacillus gorillae]|uniref:hypothetical protein n=1 Tax=Limosilactobacillus gorillae TaxID=1450649 RepID=UPI000AAEFE4D|nr:hypothetical protein [Limosilactobacillus gorillae]MDO4855603.1 hypothetical protein [Limosilactobacillus gorillae]